MRANIAPWSVARGRAAMLLAGLVAITACATHTRYRTLTEDWQRSGAV